MDCIVYIDSGVCIVPVGRPVVQPISPIVQFDQPIKQWVLMVSRQNIPGYRGWRGAMP